MKGNGDQARCHFPVGFPFGSKFPCLREEAVSIVQNVMWKIEYFIILLTVVLISAKKFDNIKHVNREKRILRKWCSSWERDKPQQSSKKLTLASCYGKCHLPWKGSCLRCTFKFSVSPLLVSVPRCWVGILFSPYSISVISWCDAVEMPPLHTLLAQTVTILLS